MDPQTLMQLLQMHQQMSQQGQLPSMSAPQPQGMPQQAPADPQQHHGGLSPLMALSPMGGLFAANPKLGMSLMSPAFGLANLFGAFK